MNIDNFLDEWRSPSPTMEVRTSGSTGTPKVIRVEKSRMLASARMTCDFLGLQEGDTAMLCMPLDYIAGKMMVVRSLERGLRLMCVEPSGHPLCAENLQSLGLSTQSGTPTISLAAMVPLQVFNTLQEPEEREALCHNVRHLVIGGGAIDPELERELCTLPTNIWSSYGMTETLSHIALRHIGETYYTPLPGINVEQNEDGCLVIDAPALHPGKLVTNDIVEFQDATHFRILGRRDNTVCSGGIKIQIEEVEAWLNSHGIKDVMVTWVEDARLGQAVVYLIKENEKKSVETCVSTLNRYWRPRAIVHVDSMPLIPTGKPDRAKAHEIAMLNLRS